MQYLTCQGKVPNQIQEKALFHFSFTSIPVHSRIFHLRNIHRLRPSVTASSAIPTKSLNKRHLLQKTAAWITSRTPPFNHISSVQLPLNFYIHLQILQVASAQFSSAQKSWKFCSTALELTSSWVLSYGYFLPLLLFLSGCFTFSIVFWLLISA